MRAVSHRAASETTNTNFSYNQIRNNFVSTCTGLHPQLGGCRACTEKPEFEDIVLKFSQSSFWGFISSIVKLTSPKQQVFLFSLHDHS